MRKPTRIAAAACLALLLLGALAPAARADQIDGEWCNAGRNFKIEGPNIRTYGGTNMTGDYNRHGFRYTVPANEPEAGSEIIMTLRGEELLDLFKQPKGAKENGAPESWRRCRVTS